MCAGHSDDLGARMAQFGVQMTTAPGERNDGGDGAHAAEGKRP
jgi:hypothetical protein